MSNKDAGIQRSHLLSQAVSVRPFSFILTLCPLMMNCVCVVYCNTVHFLLDVVGVCYVQATDLYNSQQSADPAV